MQDLVARTVEHVSVEELGINRLACGLCRSLLATRTQRECPVLALLCQRAVELDGPGATTLGLLRARTRCLRHDERWRWSHLILARSRDGEQVRSHTGVRPRSLLAFAVSLRASAWLPLGTLLREPSKSWLEQRKIIVQVLPHLLPRMLALGPVLLEKDLNEVQWIFVGLLELPAVLRRVRLSDQLRWHLLDGIVDDV